MRGLRRSGRVDGEVAVLARRGAKREHGGEERGQSQDPRPLRPPQEKQDQPDWPNVGFDFRPVMDRIDKELAARLPDFEFTRSLSTGPEQAKKILEDDKDVDGYLVYQMNCWNRVAQTAATSGKPVLYADFQYAGSGGFLVYTAGFLRAGARERRIRRLVADRRPGRGGPLLRAGQGGRPGLRFRRGDGPGPRIGRTPGPGDLACRSGQPRDRSPRTRPSGG